MNKSASVLHSSEGASDILVALSRLMDHAYHGKTCKESPCTCGLEKALQTSRRAMVKFVTPVTNFKERDLYPESFAHLKD